MKHSPRGFRWAVRLLTLPTLMVCANGLFADTIYTYTGTPFTTILGGGYTTSDFVSGTFTLDAPLVPDGKGNFLLQAVVPTYYSFSDGVQTFTSGDGSIGTFSLAETSTGVVRNWDVQIEGPTTAHGLSPAELATYFDFTDQFDAGQPAGGSINGGATTGRDPGTWEVTVAPEPSTAGLIVTGLSLSALLVVRRPSPLTNHPHLNRA